MNPRSSRAGATRCQVADERGVTVKQQHRGPVARETNEQPQVAGVDHRLGEAIEHAQSLSSPYPTTEGDHNGIVTRSVTSAGSPTGTTCPCPTPGARFADGWPAEPTGPGTPFRVEVHRMERWVP